MNCSQAWTSPPFPCRLLIAKDFPGGADGLTEKVPEYIVVDAAAIIALTVYRVTHYRVGTGCATMYVKQCDCLKHYLCMSR
jgi:hypothetical protein